MEVNNFSATHNAQHAVSPQTLSPWLEDMKCAPVFGHDNSEMCFTAPLVMYAWLIVSLEEVFVA